MKKIFYKSYRGFDQLVRATMNDLASGTSNVRTRAKKFWAKEANFTTLQMQYTLFQCTPDLSITIAIGVFNLQF